MATWNYLYTPKTGDFDSSENFNYTFRQVIGWSEILVTGINYVRVTFYSSTTGSLAINPAYIGRSTNSLDNYEFADTPVQLLFGGNSDCVIPPNSSLTSDPTLFTVGLTDTVVISWYMNVSGKGDMRGCSTASNYNAWYKVGNSSNTTPGTGFGTVFTAPLFSVLTIEGTDYITSIKTIQGASINTIKTIQGNITSSVKSINGII